MKTVSQGMGSREDCENKTPRILPQHLSDPGWPACRYAGSAIDDRARTGWLGLLVD
jgi:hypothetical protein